MLALELRPVRRLRSPGRRALLWLAAVCAVSVVVVLRYADIAVFLQRIAVPRIAIEFVGDWRSPRVAAITQRL